MAGSERQQRALEEPSIFGSPESVEHPAPEVASREAPFSTVGQALWAAEQAQQLLLKGRQRNFITENEIFVFLTARILNADESFKRTM
jgi:hypothetical protein